MRRGRRVAWAIGGLFATFIVLFAGLQTVPGQRLAAGLISSLASSPGSRIEISGLEGFIPTDMRVARIRVADRQGVWLSVEDAELHWSFASLLAGHARVDTLSARRVEVLRKPAGQSSGTASGGSITLPVGLSLKALAIDDIHLSGDLAAGHDSHWTLRGSALLAAANAQSHLKLDLKRADGPTGHASADIAFALDPLVVNGQIALEEADKGGLIAALLGRPDLDRVSIRIAAQGGRESGAITLAATAQNALTASGAAEWRRANGSTTISFDLKAASASLGPARLTTSGVYDLGADKLDASATIDVDSDGPLRERVNGLEWRNLHLDVKAALSDLRGHATGNVSISGSAADVAYGQLAPMHVDVATNVGLQRDGRLTIDRLDVSSPLASVKGSGSYRPSKRAGEVRFAVDASNLAAFSGMAGRPLDGRMHLDLSLNGDLGAPEVTWQGTLDNLRVLPLSVEEPLKLTGKASLKDGGWQVEGARAASERAALQIDGHGRGDAGELAFALVIPKLELLRPELPGSASIKVSLTYGTSTVRGRVGAEGSVAKQALSLAGDFSRNVDGSLQVPSLEGHWASASVVARDLTLMPQGATGSGHLTIARLEDLAPLLGGDLAGSIDLDIATEPDLAGKVRLALRGERLRGRGLSAASVQLDGTVSDPLGKTDTTATAKIAGLSGASDLSQVDASVKGDREKMAVELRAAGRADNASLAAEIETAGGEIRVVLQRLAGRYRNVPVALARPARVSVVGSRVAIGNASLNVGGGQVSISGALDSGNSDLTIQVARLPLAIVEAIAPGTKLDGTLQAKLRVTGAQSQPQFQATYTANGLRLGRSETALIPALTVQGNASVVRRQATFAATITAGGGTRLVLEGGSALPEGRAPLHAKVAVRGGVDLATFAAVFGNDLRNVSGTLRPDLALTLDGQTIAGSGMISLSGGALYVPTTGLRLSNGQGTMVLQGDTLRAEKIAFQTARNGEVVASGTVRLAKDAPIDLVVATHKALLANRPDLVAAVSSDIKVTGSMANGLDVQGPVTIDRAEIGIGVSRPANYPVLPVREINGKPAGDGPAAAAPPPPTAPSGSSRVRLALNVRAPQAVYVRGRGLNAEVGGEFTVTGNPSHPAVLGSLTLRRGTFNLVGHVFEFTRGNVSLVNAATIDPQLDFAATTTVESTTIEVDISGTPRAPNIALNAAPLPQDEAMAMLLFGKPSSSLSPGELLIAAQAVSELSSGAPVASGFFGRLRNSLGLDQLAVNPSSTSSGSTDLSGTSVQGGRYVAPGVYVGAEQGATAKSTRGVVEIEVLKHTKIEGAVGTDANDRIGAKMEWDY